MSSNSINLLICIIIITGACSDRSYQNINPVLFFLFFCSVVWCCAHLLVFCLVWLLCCPTLCALVHFVPCGTNLGCSWHVCVALCTHRASSLASLGRCTVHLQTPQLTALEAALVHNATWPPCIGAVARFTCFRKKQNKLDNWVDRTGFGSNIQWLVDISPETPGDRFFQRIFLIIK